jgi:hypothetical protein
MLASCTNLPIAQAKEKTVVLQCWLWVLVVQMHALINCLGLCCFLALYISLPLISSLEKGSRQMTCSGEVR